MHASSKEALPSPIESQNSRAFVDHVHQNGRKSKKKDLPPKLLAPRTVRNILTPLQEALAAAKRRRLVRENVALDAELPETRTPLLYQLTPPEMHRFLATARGDRLEGLYCLSVLGMREGELLGLCWRNVNLTTCIIQIVESMQCVKPATGRSKLSKLTWVDVKTEHGRRTILFPEEWLAVLLAHKAPQDEERVIGGGGA